MSLSDVWHEVPLLRNTLPSESLAALLAVSQAHRSQVHDIVQHIVVSDAAHTQTLVSGTWPSLLTWKLSDSLNIHPAAIDATCCTLRYANDAVLLLLAKRYFHTLRHLSLNSGSITAAGIAQLNCASWSHCLESCSLYGTDLPLRMYRRSAVVPGLA